MGITSRSGASATGSGGTTLIAGTQTPSDVTTNRSDAVDVLGYSMVFDPSLGAGGLWVRWYGSVALGGRIQETQAPQYEDNVNGVAAVQTKILAVSTYAPTLFTQLGTDPDVSVKATPGNVFSVQCTNLNAAKRYLQLHNKASAPAGGDTPLLVFPLAPGGAAAVSDSMTLIGTDFFGTYGVFFSVGIAYGFSTTMATYTAGAAGDQFAAITFK